MISFAWIVILILSIGIATPDKRAGLPTTPLTEEPCEKHHKTTTIKPPNPCSVYGPFELINRDNGAWCMALLSVPNSYRFEDAEADCLSRGKDRFIVMKLANEKENIHWTRVAKENNVSGIWVGTRFNSTSKMYHWRGMKGALMSPQPQVKDAKGHAAWFLNNNGKMNITIVNDSGEGNPPVNGVLCGTPAPGRTAFEEIFMVFLF